MSASDFPYDAIEKDAVELREIAEWFDVRGIQLNGDFLRKVATRYEVVAGAYRNKKDALIAKQQIEIEELKTANAELNAQINAAYTKIICIGGPLNDNVRRYTKEQLREWQSVADCLDGAGFGGGQ